MNNKGFSRDDLRAFLESLDGYNPEVDIVKETEGDDEDLDIQMLGHIIEIEERNAAVINTDVLKNIGTVYGLLQRELSDSNVKISYELHKPYQSMGYVMVEGREIHFNNTSALRKCMDLASNTEAYPMAKNAVRIVFTFHGLTNKIREADAV